jgi:hypothetical protein
MPSRGNQRMPAKALSRNNNGGGKNSTAKPIPAAAPASPGGTVAGVKPEAKILFQKFFKSIGPRTYAAQIKEAHNGNHFLVLTEGKRDEATNEVRKTRIFIFSEDFREFFRMLQETAVFIKANPVPEEVRKRRERHWAKKGDSDDSGAPISRAPIERKPQPSTPLPSNRKRA